MPSEEVQVQLSSLSFEHEARVAIKARDIINFFIGTKYNRFGVYANVKKNIYNTLIINAAGERSYIFSNGFG